MSRKELWDAADINGNLLGFDLVRGEPVPEGVYHHVVMIFTLTDQGNILITQRHPGKTSGMSWEITSGSVLRAETPLDGAVRELREETGISVSPEEMIPVPICVRSSLPAIYNLFLTHVKEKGLRISLQEEETIGWKLIPWSQFKQLLTDGFFPLFPESFSSRFSEFEPILDCLAFPDLYPKVSPV